MSDTPDPAIPVPTATPGIDLSALGLTDADVRMANLIRQISELNRTIQARLTAPQFLDAVGNRIMASGFLNDLIDRKIEQALIRQAKGQYAQVKVVDQSAAIEPTVAPPGSTVIGHKAKFTVEDNLEINPIQITPTNAMHPLFPNSFDAYVALDHRDGSRQWLHGREQITLEAIAAIEAELKEDVIPLAEFRFVTITPIFGDPQPE